LKPLPAYQTKEFCSIALWEALATAPYCFKLTLAGNSSALIKTPMPVRPLLKN
jgi:hypothetical protein